MNKDRDAFPRDGENFCQFVNPGETLTASQVFYVPTSTPGLVGWQVTLNVDSDRLGRGMHWLDQVFVPLPE